MLCNVQRYRLFFRKNTAVQGCCRYPLILSTCSLIDVSACCSYGHYSFSSTTLSMTAAAWLKPVSLVRSWASLTVLRTANSSFAPTSARHRVLLGGRHRLAHQIVRTVEGRV